MAETESVVGAVRADIDALGELAGHGAASKRAIALELAKRLEDAEDKSAAGVAKELRAVLAELAAMATTPDDLDDELSEPS